MNEYVPILVLGAIALAFALFSVVIAPFTGPKRYNRAKLDRYESGIAPSPLPEGGGRVSIKYFFTAMMFIIFDIEIVFLYPFAVAFDQLSWFAFFAVMLFLVNITIAYVYEWRRGGMEWT
ncbi:NADH-quinone oxidoreductase subunit A [Aeromicrobium sp. YIM 150415]|uniref:NADH-quinone oxidoreductase subunit n=1 Tax=Aeromicrobium piscarium TaxID=2590901 RepID=A0A554SBE9_9ACTN|nr:MULTISPECIES: NADH-quinone oxidoreductase subunit A [Aeromicrobium]MBM9464825.1 NADH-quinone oxidoreductase subunit A [Aeromicrobium sp. YIM 150415]OUZ10634.1 NADH-quinone oxidoreductase subunit A [Aeromicrobium sp. PE09-221]TSD63670.1 NADH-quinone oxidoreductase subunit A [Aeromicrobium piscarium]